jgi:hypothetical protein
MNQPQPKPFGISKHAVLETQGSPLAEAHLRARTQVVGALGNRSKG